MSKLWTPSDDDQPGEPMGYVNQAGFYRIHYFVACIQRFLVGNSSCGYRFVFYSQILQHGKEGVDLAFADKDGNDRVILQSGSGGNGLLLQDAEERERVTLMSTEGDENGLSFLDEEGETVWAAPEKPAKPAPSKS